MFWLFYMAPITYTALQTAAAIRHDLCGPVLGTHASDLSMQAVYPVDPLGLYRSPLG